MMISAADFICQDFKKELASSMSIKGNIFLYAAIQPYEEKVYYIVKNKNEIFEYIHFKDAVDKYNELINNSNKKDVEFKTIDMNGFNSLFDNLEEYFNSKGYTLGTDADGLQELMHCIQYCNIYGVTTDEQLSDMKTKFRKFVSASLSKIETVDNT